MYKIEFFFKVKYKEVWFFLVLRDPLLSTFAVKVARVSRQSNEK